MKYETFRFYRSHKPVGIQANRDDYKTVAQYHAAHMDDIYEYSYDEYHFYEDGDITISQGTEDFSVRRLSEFKYYEILGWYGEYNRGGHKKWEVIETVRVTTATPAQLKRYANRSLFAEDFSIRKL